MLPTPVAGETQWMVALTKRHTGTGQYNVDHLRQCGPPCLKVSAAHIELQDVTSAEM